MEEKSEIVIPSRQANRTIKTAKLVVQILIIHTILATAIQIIVEI